MPQNQRGIAVLGLGMLDREVAVAFAGKDSHRLEVAPPHMAPLAPHSLGRLDVIPHACLGCMRGPPALRSPSCRPIGFVL
jgi:hypothetical protein